MDLVSLLVLTLSFRVSFRRVGLIKMSESELDDGKRRDMFRFLLEEVGLMIGPIESESVVNSISVKIGKVSRYS